MNGDIAFECVGHVGRCGAEGGGKVGDGILLCNVSTGTGGERNTGVELGNMVVVDQITLGSRCGVRLSRQRVPAHSERTRCIDPTDHRVLADTVSSRKRSPYKDSQADIRDQVVRDYRATGADKQDTDFARTGCCRKVCPDNLQVVEFDIAGILCHDIHRERPDFAIFDRNPAQGSLRITDDNTATGSGRLSRYRATVEVQRNIAALDRDCITAFDTDVTEQYINSGTINNQWALLRREELSVGRLGDIYRSEGSDYRKKNERCFSSEHDGSFLSSS